MCRYEEIKIKLTARNNSTDSAQQEKLVGAKLARVTGSDGSSFGSALRPGEGSGEGALASGFDQ